MNNSHYDMKNYVDRIAEGVAYGFLWTTCGLFLLLSMQYDQEKRPRYLS